MTILQKLFKPRAPSETPIKPKSQPIAALATNMRLVAVGDIHGMLSELRQLHTKVASDLKVASLQPESFATTWIYLGDYVDRGPESAGVIDYLLEIKNKLLPGNEMIFLRGNHEQLLLDFLEQENDDAPFWLRSGGFETLESYGVFLNRKHNTLQRNAAREELRRKVPPTHLKFLKETQLSHTIGDYYFCHATIDPDVSLEKQVAKDLLWSRNTKFLDENYIGKLIVHGHTPVKTPVLAKGHANVDTGAYATGQLSALILFGTDQYFISNKS